MECFPVQTDGSIVLDFHQRWLRKRSEIDEQLTEEQTARRRSSAAMQTDDGAISNFEPLPSNHAVQQNLAQNATIGAKSCFSMVDNNSTSWMNPMSMFFGNALTPSSMQPNSTSDTKASPMSMAFWGNPAVVQPSQPQQQPQMILVTPKAQDVLFGRGKPTRNHPGNIKFRNMMESHADEYNKAPKFVKSLIAKKLVQAVVSSGSRFLKPVGSNQWVSVDEKTAQDKVSQYFRSRRGTK